MASGPRARSRAARGRAGDPPRATGGGASFHLSFTWMSPAVHLAVTIVP